MILGGAHFAQGEHVKIKALACKVNYSFYSYCLYYFTFETLGSSEGDSISKAGLLKPWEAARVTASAKLDGNNSTLVNRLQIQKNINNHQQTINKYVGLSLMLHTKYLQTSQKQSFVSCFLHKIIGF
jgi:hypothetical protein